MSKSSCDHKPSVTEAYANGKTMVRYNIEEVERRSLRPDSEETSTEWEFDFVIVDNPLTYGLLVDAMVRAEYSVSDEFALLRQRDEKAEEFAKYNTFVEQCKVKAKEVIDQINV